MSADESTPDATAAAPASPAPGPDVSAGEPSARRRLPSRRALLIALLAVPFVVTGCRVACDRLVTRADRVAARDPATGILIGAEERDLGPPDAREAVLFVHGILGGGNNFWELPDRVAATGRRVRVVRLPGHGTSPRDLERTSPEELIEAVRSEIATMKAEREKVFVVTHSMGGALATLATAELPPESRPDGIVLGGAYFGVTHRWFYGLRPETWNRLVGGAVRWLYKGQVFQKIARKDQRELILSYAWMPTAGVRTLIELGRRANRPETLDAITCPVLALHGVLDGAASPAATRAAFDRMPSNDRDWVDLPRSDHLIFWDYDRELACEATLAFLDRAARDSPRSPPAL